MDPDADRVQNSNQTHGIGVDKSVDDKDCKVDQDRVPALKDKLGRERDDGAEQHGESEIDSCSTSKLAQQVPPSSDPGVERALVASQLAAPVVQTTT